MSHVIVAFNPPIPLVLCMIALMRIAMGKKELP